MAYADTTSTNRVLGSNAATSVTVPTLVDLANIITGIAGQIDSVLKGAGVATVPFTSDVDSEFHAFLIAVNVWGAAAEFLKGMYSEATGPGESPAFAFWQKKYDATLKAWREGKDLPAGILSGANDTSPSSYFTRNPEEEETLGELAGASMNKIADVF